MKLPAYEFKSYVETYQLQDIKSLQDAQISDCFRLLKRKSGIHQEWLTKIRINTSFLTYPNKVKEFFDSVWLCAIKLDKHSGFSFFKLTGQLQRNHATGLDAYTSSWKPDSPYSIKPESSMSMLCYSDIDLSIFEKYDTRFSLTLETTTIDPTIESNSHANTKKCKCDMQIIMAHGCQCGGV